MDLELIKICSGCYGCMIDYESLLCVFLLCVKTCELVISRGLVLATMQGGIVLPVPQPAESDDNLQSSARPAA